MGCVRSSDAAGFSRSFRPSNHPNATDQDGRCLRRYRRCWIVKRTIGWLGNLRGLTVRYDWLTAICGGFFHLAWVVIVLRRVVK